MPTAKKSTSWNGRRGGHELDLAEDDQNAQILESLIETQNELEASRQRYADLYDFAHVGYVTLDDAGVVREINLTGVGFLDRRRRSMVLRSAFSSYVCRPHMAAFLEHLRRCNRREPQIITELELKRKSGPGLPVQLVSNPIADSARYRTIITDLTEREKIGSALKESEQRFRALVEHSSEAVCAGDVHGKITYASPSTERITGYASEELVGRNVFDLIHPDDAERVRKSFEKIVKSGDATTIECRIRRSDGGWTWFEAAVTNMLDNPAVQAIVANYRDISERKETESAFNRLMEVLQSERTRLTIHHSVLSVLAKSMNLTEAAPRILKSIGENIGWRTGGFWVVDPATHRLRPVSFWHAPRSRALAFIDASRACVFASDEGLPGGVLKIGKPVWLKDIAAMDLPRSGVAGKCGLHAAFAFPILLSGGEIRGVVEFFNNAVLPPQRDLLETVAAIGAQVGQFIQRADAVAALHASEEALKQANDALEARVRERTAELRKSNAALSAEIARRKELEQELLNSSERERRRFGQDLHDGLCQQVAAIAFMAQAAAKKLRNDSHPEAEALTEIAKLSLAAVKEARNVARGLHPVELDSSGFMAALEQLALRVSEKTRCRIDCPEPVLVNDPDLALNLYRIAQEALANAVKHANATQIVISLSQRAGKILVCVTDNGAGFSKRAEARRGMGLDLMTYRAHVVGGTILIDEPPQGGTRVTCMIPTPKAAKSSKSS